MVLKKIYLSLIFLTSLYFSVGGLANIHVKERRETFLSTPATESDSTLRDMANQITQEELTRQNRIFPYYNSLSASLCYLITLMALGMLGALTKIFLLLLNQSTPLDAIPIYSITVLGAIGGLATTLIGVFIPDFAKETGNNQFFYAVAFLVGLYSKEFFRQLGSRFNNLMGNPEGKESQADTAKEPQAEAPATDA